MRYSQEKDPWYTKKTWAEISGKALVNNLEIIRSYIPDPRVRVAPVVKANAYGHCAEIVVPILEEAGVDALLVATIDEAIFLRQAGARSSILIFGTTKSEHIPYLKRYRLTQTLVTEAEVESFARQSEKTGGPPLDVNIKLDTGMTRLGLMADERHRQMTVEVMLAAARQPSLKVTGVYSHLATADCDRDYADLQLARFAGTLEAAERAGFPRVIRHLANSAALVDQPDYHFDMVRPGIVLYGGRAGPSKEAWAGLRPVMTVKSVIEQVALVDAGTRVSYGATWTTPVDSILAVVNMGYGDGLSRQLSNRGSFFHKGREVPIRGRVCMDRCIIDVTGLPDVVAGDEVTFFGDDGLIRKDASDIADLYGTIDYEIYCGINERVPRMRVD
jgi:alanine racemase